MYLNKVMLYGNLTRDPELRSMPNGNKVTSFSLATNRVYIDTAGAKQESVTYHNVVAFGKPAETINQYLKKGQGVYVEGRIENRSWDDKTTGEKKYRTEIIVDNFQFGPKSSGGSSSSYGAGEQPASSKPSVEPKKPGLDSIDYGDSDINLDDIPF